MSDSPPRGGWFVLEHPSRVFAPENFNDQQRLIAQTAEAFAQQEVVPAVDTIERRDLPALRQLLRRAGELGLTAADIPEEYGGMGMDGAASAIIADHLAVNGSFSVAFGAHAGIATLPLVHFGNEEQKRKYLPKLASAAWVGAYALSEAGSGSDALALRTQAEPAPGGGEYLLNGEKMWISNAGLADLFTVFAKVGDKVTAFLVEAGFPGVSTGAEENKMGIHGSSTRPLLLRDARVPAANVLGEIGGGAHIAFQILNVGRFKLGAACIGGARNLLRATIAYARERHAFGKPIASFGLVQEMLAQSVAGLYAAEAAVYRTAGLMPLHGLEEYAVECSIIKVAASEMLDRIVDAAVQIHGGNGFVHGNPAERAFRDARVNRIFEGTNEINRLLTAGLLLRRARSGALPLPAAIAAVTSDLLGAPARYEPCEAARRVALLVAGVAYRRFGERLADEEEALAAIADLLLHLYLMQSVTARNAACPAAALAVEEGLDKMEWIAKRALAAISEGDELRTQLAWLKRLFRRDPVNLVALRRRIAAAAIEAGQYPYRI